MPTSGVGPFRWPPGRKSGMAGFVSIPFRNLLERIGQNANFRGGALPVATGPEIGGGRVGFDSL